MWLVGLTGVWLIRCSCHSMLSRVSVDRLARTSDHRRCCMPLRIEPMTIHRIHRCRRGSAIVDRSELVAIPAGRLLMCGLFRSCLYMPFLNGGLFLCRRPGRNTSRAPVETGTIVHDRRIVHDDGTVDISIVYYCCIYIHYGRIIPESSSFPSSSSKSGAAVSISIVHAAIETDMRSPIAGMPSITPPGITPVTRRP